MQTIMERSFEKCFRVSNSFRETILVIRITFVSARPPSYKNFYILLLQKLDLTDQAGRDLGGAPLSAEC